MNENLKNNAAQIIKGLAIVSFLFFIFAALYIIGVASGNISTTDDSTLGHVINFFIQRPFIVGTMIVVMVWGYIISLREEKREKETGTKRPVTKIENKFYNFWDKALSGKK